VENIKYSDFIQIDDQKTHDYDGEEILVCLSASYYDNHRIFNLLKQYNQNTKSSNIFRIRKHPGSYRISMIDNNWVHQTDGVVFDKYSNCEDSIRNSIGVIASYSSVIQEAHEMNVPVILISDLVKRSNFNFKNIFNIETYTEFNIAIKNILMIFGNKKC